MKVTEAARAIISKVSSPPIGDAIIHTSWYEELLECRDKLLVALGADKLTTFHGRPLRTQEDRDKMEPPFPTEPTDLKDYGLPTPESITAGLLIKNIKSATGKPDPERPDLEAIEARANAAMPGPWKSGEGVLVSIGPPSTSDEYQMSRSVTAPACPSKYGLIPHGILHKIDADFIAATRTDIPALLAYCRRLEALVAELEGRGTMPEERI